MDHEKYIRRCLELAELGKGIVSPNPMVGSVIVLENEIIGEGFHHKAGEPHAEVNAINSVKNKELLKQATIYVSLEPCSHFGKTPPCADLIIENQIPKVVIASIDSNARVCGNGISKLKKAGIDVITGVLEKDSNQLNKTFNTFHKKKRPFIILKWAETANGFIDTNRKNSDVPSLKISNEASSRWVHKLRGEVDALLVGKNTAFLDNPTLTTRKWAGKNPIRVVIDKDLSLPKTLNLFTDGLPTLIMNKTKSSTENAIEHIKITEEFIPELTKQLYQRNIQSVLVEGGAKTLQQFIDLNLWDEAFVIKSKLKITSGVESPKISTKYATIVTMGSDQIYVYD